MSEVISRDVGAVAPETMTESAVALWVPLSKLFLSPHNVRAGDGPSAEGIERLAAMIEAQGLLNDLHVSQEVLDGQPTGRYAVEAGGRRWRALQVLAQRGRLSPDAPVRCKRVEASQALAVSLAENLGQEAMHPADEFAAFARLAGEGTAPEAIAAHFGVTVAHVLRRMRLAAVAPSLLKLYRQGKATLDQMMALASVDDARRQTAAWKALPAWGRSAQALRAHLQRDEVRSDDDRVRLIGLARYEACGGTTRRDLFTDEVFLTDAGLVDLVFAEVLAERAQAVEREGWGWVEVVPSMRYEERQRFVEPPVSLRPEDEAQRVEREGLEARRDALDEALYALDGEEGEEGEKGEDAEGGCDGQAQREGGYALRQQRQAVQRELDALRQSRLEATPQDRRALGCVVTVQGGRVQVLRGLMTAEAARSKAVASRRESMPEAAGGVVATAAGDGLSESLVHDLTSHLTGASQASLLVQPAVALAVLAWTMAESALGMGLRRSPMKVSVTGCRGRLESLAGGFAASRAAKALDAQAQHWQAKLPEDRGAWLDWLLAQPQETSVSLIVFCSALSLDLIRGRGEASAEGQRVAAALGLDMADWWQADGASYLSSVPKARISAAVREACGAQAASALEGLKKAEAVALAAERLQGTRWLPVPLRHAAS